MFAIAAFVLVVLWFLNGAVLQLPAPLNQALLIAALVCAGIFAWQQVRKRQPPPNG